MSRRALAILSSALAGAAAWAQPLVTPDQTLMALDDLGLYAVGYAYRGQPEQQFPLGWSGFFEDRTGVACEPFGTQNGQPAFLLHCPWRNGTGIAFQQFNFQVPAGAQGVSLTGATAMASAYFAKSDGVTFRVFANGVKLLERHHTNDVWQPFAFDFPPVAGSNLLLRFETDPGPQNNASFDYSLWGSRTLIFAGYNPPPVVHPPPPALSLSNVWPAQTGNIAPRSGFAASNSVEVAGSGAHLRYAGPDGSLDYFWQAPQTTNDPLFGALTLTAQMTDDAPVSLPLANAAKFSWTQTAAFQSAVFQPTNGGVLLLETWRLGTTNFGASVLGQILGKSLILSVACDQPWVSGLDAGVWGPVLRRRQLAVPYYPEAIHYFPRENLFAGVILDWTASAASSQQGSRATYNALTDGTHNRLQERVVFTAAWHPAEVMPNIPNPPSPWLGFLANKVVLDIWGGTFATIATNLNNLADYGITNCLALVHNWQRSGYDNALPAHVPANASLGGDPGMSNLVAAATRCGVRAALHENYVDYYPNYDFYNTNDIALDSQGRLVLAWSNASTHIQSYAVKPNAILPLAATQSPQIHERYHTLANYLDVHSAVAPWFHVDYRASEAGAGTFARVWDVHRQLWAYERETHQGPVFGEGNRHWYWSGCLDGVEAQFGSGWPGNQGLTAPLHVDFDLLKIHPLQFNHGMGYLERWWPDDYHTNWSGATPLIVLDQYRVQEVAYGHAGFLSGSDYTRIPIAWLEHHLLSPVTARYGSARPLEIAYEDSGAWLDPAAAAKLATPRDRVRVTYENGLVVTANAATNLLAVGNWLLPPSGWLAQGAGITAGTVLRDGVFTDFADTGDSLFVNARSAADWNFSNFKRVHPAVAQFQQTASRAFRVTYQWGIGDALPLDYRCFVHFCQTNVIKFQQDHTLTPPTSQWQPGQTNSDGPYTITVSSGMPDGDYDWLIGLYDTATGARVRLQGIDDGQSRIRLGTLRLANSGAQVSFLPEANTNYPDPSVIYHANLNTAGKVIDFGATRTDGSAWLRWDGRDWVLKTWPRGRNFTLEFSTARFGVPSLIRCTGGATNQLTPVALGDHWRVPLNGASEYRWSTNRLNIRRAASQTGQVELSWPTWAATATLWSTTNLGSPTLWSPVTNGVITSNEEFCVALTPGPENRFFRLQSPGLISRPLKE